MKTLKKLSFCAFALFVSFLILYADILLSFPSQIIMYKDQPHKQFLGAGVFICDIPHSAQAVSSGGKIVPARQGEYEASLKIGNAIPFRKITLKVTTPQSVCASGALVGLRIHNRGLIVTQLAPVNSKNGEVCPAESAGIVPGDVLLEINGNPLNCSEDVGVYLSENCILTVLGHSSVRKVTLSPARDISDGKLKLGLWVRDSTAGVGTLTYFDTTTNTFGALGHGISDADTSTLFEVQSGTLEKSQVVSVKKGKRGAPGELCGSFSYSDNVTGTISKNCEAGIFGKIFPDASIQGKLYPIGVMSQVEIGSAKILSTVDDSIKEYDISILRSMPFGSATKGLVIKITDPDLLEKTGGIVQGMSGSPIVQNGKIIGAVTHVLVNDPTRGYGIFIENMLKESE